MPQAMDTVVREGQQPDHRRVQPGAGRGPARRPDRGRAGRHRRPDAEQGLRLGRHGHPHPARGRRQPGRAAHHGGRHAARAGAAAPPGAACSRPRAGCRPGSSACCRSCSPSTSLLVRPEYLKPLVTDPLGWLLLGVGVDAAGRRRAVAAQGRQGGGLTWTPTWSSSLGLAGVFLAVAIAAGHGRRHHLRASAGQSLARRRAGHPRRAVAMAAGARTSRSPSGCSTPALARFTGLGRRLTPGDQVARIRHRLELAGNPPGWDVDRVIAFKVLGLLAGLALGDRACRCVLGAGFLAVVGCRRRARRRRLLRARTWRSTRSAYNRTEQMRRELPDALDLLTISRRGRPRLRRRRCRRSPATRPGPLAEEFFRVLQEMQIGLGRIRRAARARRAHRPRRAARLRHRDGAGRRVRHPDRRTSCACRPGRCGSSAASAPRSWPRRCR